MNEPIFPKGVHQLLGWSYSMLAVDPHEPTAHQKLIELRGDGMIRPVSIAGINFGDIRDEMGKFGLAAGIRDRVERKVKPEQCSVIWAKYCDSFSKEGEPLKREGITGVSGDIHIRRSKAYIACCVWHVVCTDKEREDCSMYTIGKKFGVSAMTVCRDVKKIRDYMRDIEASAAVRIRKAFGPDVV